LSLDDEITKYVPDFDTGGRHVTVEHLLTHTSGIKNYTDVAAWKPTWGQDLTPSQLVAFVKPDAFEFAPGTRWAYSNTGYILLGMIIEKASGKTYAEFMRDEVLLPLGLSRTMYDDPMKIMPRRAHGYVRVNGEYANAPYLSMTHPFSAGALVSTVDDLARWDAALSAHRLLTLESLGRMFVPYRLQSGESAGYALGWDITSYEGHAVAEHGGGIPGFTCHVVRFAEDKMYVAVLSNDTSDVATRTAHLLAALAVGRPFTNPPEVNLSSTTLDSFAGRYVKGENVVTVSRAENHLKYDTGHSTVDLAASAGTAFFEPGGSLRVTFSNDAHGGSRQMTVGGWGDSKTYVRD
jgi:CubicO group peptidase (beta-lactamase class C family)